MRIPVETELTEGERDALRDAELLERVKKPISDWRKWNASSPWEERYAYTRRGSGGGRVPLADANHPAKPAHKHHLVKIGQAPVKMAAANALLLLQPSAVLVNWRQDNAAPRGDASIAICSARWARKAVHLAWTESMRRIIEGAQSQFCRARNYYGTRCQHDAEEEPAHAARVRLL